MKQTLIDLIVEAWTRAGRAGALPDVPPAEWKLEIPKNPEHGDYAANIAMVNAKTARLAPRKIAETLLAHIEDPGGVLASHEIAGPGFINFKLTDAQWHKVLVKIETQGENYGASTVGHGRKVQVEFVSANPTGPLHVGHGRGAALGDVLARVLTVAGYDVDREYYINDAGNQIATLGGSVYLRYQELRGEPVEFPATYYQGDYIIDIAREVLAAEGDKYAAMAEADAIQALGTMAGDRILHEIDEDLKAFGVTFDRWYSEQSLYDRGKVREVLERLEASGAAYREEGALWLRTSAHGDEKDRVLVRADGRETYFASDIAYHIEKIERGYERIIDIWGADHHGYVPRVKAALATVGADPKVLDVLMVQLVNLLRDGVMVNMSTRAGEFVTLQQVREDVGADAARFIFLTRTCDQTLDFDLEVAKSKTKDNPVYYVQYAHARIASVYKGAAEAGLAPKLPSQVDLSPLDKDEERELLKFLNVYPELIETVAENLEVHRIAYYLQELASRFHTYYNNKDNKIVGVEESVSLARLALVGMIRQVLANGLGVMGVSAPESM